MTAAAMAAGQWYPDRRPARPTSAMPAQDSPQRAAGRPDVGAWYRQHGASVYRRILRFYPPQEAEEVLQEVFVRVLRTADTWRGESAPSTWLYAVATRHCLNRLRDARRREELLLTHGRPAWSQEVDHRDPEARVFLTQLWKELDDELAMVGVLYFVDDLTHAQIADVLGVSRRTVGNRLVTLQARARAAAGLEEEA